MNKYLISTLTALIAGCALAATTPIVREIHSEKELMQLIQTEKHVIVNFSKPDCPYCDYLDPIYKQVAQDCKTPVIFAAMKIRSNPEFYKRQFKFNTVPTVVYFKNGKQLRSHGSEDKTVTQQYFFDIISKIYAVTA